MEQANSTNLPTVNLSMITEFIVFSPLFTRSEFRYEKLQHSGRDEYGDNAIGWVQLERSGNVCTVSMQVTPEHNIRNKPYGVSTKINENTKRITKCVCDGCVSSEGGCKHIMSALCWLFRRTNEPAPTSVQCYWRKSLLSDIRTRGLVVEISTMKGIGNFKRKNLLPKSSIFDKWVEHAKNTKINSQLSLYYANNNECIELTVINLVRSLNNTMTKPNLKQFKEYSRQILTNDVCEKVEVLTRNQSKCNLWNKLRFGRITASIAYEVSCSKKVDGTLSERILGGKKFKPTRAMKRGLEIESKVFKILEKKYPNLKNCGLILNSKYPIFGASPDAINDNAVFEIKSPISNNNIKYYVLNGQLKPKVKSQINLQMLLTGKRKGYLVIADEKFAENNLIKIYEEKFDKEFTENLIKLCEKYFEQSIYPKLLTMI